ncbi:MAG: hypothetical protein CL897_04640 [Dehalococcoidia bacterium]|nr:hypothetical protein [Dehalococcoidia bacterium]HCV00915.1 hypothetical protein [Dehalococcoidia bacterium]
MTAGSAVASRAAFSHPSARRLRYASFEMRFAAVAIDALVLFFVAGVLIIAGSVNLLLSSDFDRVNASGGAINLFWALVGAVPLAVFLYFFLGFAFWGKTAGAAIMRISVVRSDGAALGVFGALARVMGMLSYVLLLAIGAVLAFVLRSTPAAAGAFVGLSLLVCVAGFLWAVFDPYRRALHDRIAGTIVVQGV